MLPDQLFACMTDVVDIETAVINAQKTAQETIKSWALTYPNIAQRADDIWYNGNRLIVVEDNALRRGVTLLYYNSTTAGHPGTLKTCVMMAEDFLLRFASFLTFLPADHDTLDDYGTALTHGVLPGIPF